MELARGFRALAGFLRRRWRDPLLDADYVVDFRPGPKEDAVPWPPREGASRTARTSVTATRWRG